MINLRIEDLKVDSKVDVLEVTIKEKGEVRQVNTRFGQPGRVCDAKGVDASGENVSISLWNDEIDRVHVNDRIRITNGWAREWRGDIQVSAGKFGKLEVLK